MSKLYWVRVYRPKDPRKGLHGHVECFLESDDVIRLMCRKVGACKDVVSMETGELFQKELQPPFPKWLNEPLTREMRLRDIKPEERKL